ncbi:MAG: hypothetical protein PF961_06820 [Planctomycetota bacterium]|jgi:uncharacterized protein involved in exopolysaccharide biosynthesis|nr:hypothetical protein [Planctomycetota bacterium]
MAEKKPKSSQSANTKEITVSLARLGLDKESITTLPSSLLEYLGQLQREFSQLQGEVNQSHEDLERLRTQRDALRAALQKAEGDDPIDAAEYSQPLLPRIDLPKS